MKSALIYGLRFVLTAAMIAWLTTQVDLRSVAAVVAEANMLWLVAGVLVNLLSIVCAAWRWQQLLAGMGVSFPLLQLLRLVLAGAFFNMFLPSSVGGDLMKMALIAPDLERREAAISSVLMDRVVGLAVTIAVGMAAVMLLPSVWDDAGLLISLGLALLVFALGAASMFSRRLVDLAGRLAPGFIWRRLGPTVVRVHASLLMAAHRPDVLLRATGISVLRQIAICASVYCAGQAFALPLGPIAYFATVPIAIAITALPIAINGLGLQDNALIFLLGFVGLTAAQALSLSIFLHAMRNGIGLVGGVVFALTRGQGAPAPAAEPALTPAEASARKAELS
jgi:uncharacterized protein (TIRG00374 family)